MKKIISIMLALVLALSMTTIAFATEVGGEEAGDKTNVTYEDMSTITLTKEYKLTNPGTISPAETFTFSELTCISVSDAGYGVTAANAPVPTIGNVSYLAGEAGSATAKKDITINLPTYTSVGIYTYTFNEIDNSTAGVTYRADEIKLVVTVIEQNGKVRVAAVHTENGKGDKSDVFDNTYSAGSLSVTKTVTGLMGDQDKYFFVDVTFTAPAGKTIHSDIYYTILGEENAVEATATGWGGTKTAEIALKHGDTITFTNIPYGVTYTVTERDYTSEGYDAASYDGKQTGTINDASVTTVITNNKGGIIDTGIGLDSLPYVLMLVVVCSGAVVFFSKKRASREN